MNKTFKMNYLAKDFSTLKQELLNYAKRYYSDKFSDLSESSITSFMVDSVAYAGDILSYYLDYQSNESFLATAFEDRNVLNLAKSLGYKRRDTYSTAGKITIYMLLPNNGNNEPDYTKAPTIKKGTQLTSRNGINYITSDDIKPNSNLVNKNFVVARTNEIGNPLYYAIKFDIPIISGRLLFKDFTVGSFIKFRKINLEEQNIAEIISIIDSEGNEYYEVPNLSQNIIYRSFYNSDTDPKYILKAVTAQRRFVFDYEDNSSYILFGSKQYRPDDDLSYDPVTEPIKFALNKYNNEYIQDNYFEPNSLLNGDTYGISPENTTLRVTYRVSGGERLGNINNSANIGDITGISNLLYNFDNPLIPANEVSTIVSSIQATNEEPIIGQDNIVSLSEMKDLAGNIYNAQNRAVTSKDYETICYMMPAKFGSIKRVKVDRDPNSLKNNINLYICCSNADGSLVNANSIIKENLKTWISNYKVITDTVDILDAKIINFGINFTVLVDPNFSKVETVASIKTHLEDYFSFKPHIGESFNILNVYREIRKFRSVLDIKSVKIRNITQAGYSTLGFNVQNNLSNDETIIKIPKNAIYEIKYPSLDIIGNAI